MLVSKDGSRKAEKEEQVFHIKSQAEGQQNKGRQKEDKFSGQ